LLRKKKENEKKEKKEKKKKNEKSGKKDEEAVEDPIEKMRKRKLKEKISLEPDAFLALHNLTQGMKEKVHVIDDLAKSKSSGSLMIDRTGSKQPLNDIGGSAGGSKKEKDNLNIYSKGKGKEKAYSTDEEGSESEAESGVAKDPIEEKLRKIKELDEDLADEEELAQSEFVIRDGEDQNLEDVLRSSEKR